MTRERRRHQTRVGAGEGGRLDRFVAQWLSEALGEGVSNRRAKGLIEGGGVRVNGRAPRGGSARVGDGARIEAQVDDAWLESLRPEPLWALPAEAILYEDEALIIVDKPAGLSTQATVADREQHLYGAVQRHLATREGRTVYVGLHHRLDRETSGVVLMTVSKAANRGTAALFRERRIEKRYWALSAEAGQGRGERWVMEGRLRRAGPEGDGDDGRWARSTCRVLDRGVGGALIEVSPSTGRRHQVRLHLAMSGLPLCGDLLYHPEGRGDSSRLMLHALSVRFAHPITGASVEVESAPPEDFEAMMKVLGVHGPDE